jgi:hypothetical protein
MNPVNPDFMNDITCSKIDDVVRSHPTRTVLAAVGTGVFLGVLARLLLDRKEHTRAEAVMDAVRGFGCRVRSIFH